MSDEKPPMPPQPTTKQLPKVEVPQDQMTVVIQELRAIRTDIGLVANDVSLVKERVRLVEVRVGSVEDQQKSNSIRARVDTESQVNLKQDAAIANVITRLDSVEANQQSAAKERADTAAMVKEVRDTVVGVATNKKVLFVGKVLFFAAAAYSAAHGLKVLP